MMSKKESGFTLIEIVMVLVLLGILMAVAAPKYFDLQEDALKQTAKAAAAEWQARFNAHFARQLLNDDTCDIAVERAVEAMKTDKADIFTDDSKLEFVGDVENADTNLVISIKDQTDKKMYDKKVVFPVCDASEPITQ